MAGRDSTRETYVGCITIEELATAGAKPLALVIVVGAGISLLQVRISSIIGLGNWRRHSAERGDGKQQKCRTHDEDAEDFVLEVNNSVVFV